MLIKWFNTGKIHSYSYCSSGHFAIHLKSFTAYRTDTCSLNQENNWEAVIRFQSTCHAQHCVCSLSSCYYLKYKMRVILLWNWNPCTIQLQCVIKMENGRKKKIKHSLNKLSFKVMLSREFDWFKVLWSWQWETAHHVLSLFNKLVLFDLLVWNDVFFFYVYVIFAFSRYFKTACHQQMFCNW